MKTMLSKKSVMSSILFVALVDFAITHGCMYLQGLVIPYPTEDVAGAFIYDAVSLASFGIPLVAMLAFMFFTKRESLRVFAGGMKKSLRAAAIGILIGFVANGAISVVVGATGGASYVFNSLSPLLVAIAPLCFIQCLAEEVSYRGFVPAYLEERHSWVVVGIVGGVLFALGHITNLMYYGFNVVFILNVVLVGMILYLLTKQFQNFWVAPGFHFAWNYSQQYVFGLPNSGSSIPYALFTGTNPQSTFFYDATYGNEGSMLTLIVFLVMIAVLVALRRKEAAA